MARLGKKQYIHIAPHGLIVTLFHHYDRDFFFFISQSLKICIVIPDISHCPWIIFFHSFCISVAINIINIVQKCWCIWTLVAGWQSKPFLCLIVYRTKLATINHFSANYSTTYSVYKVCTLKYNHLNYLTFGQKQ